MQNTLGNDFSLFLLGLFAMLALGKLFGKCAKKLGFAEVAGELIAGILLGPTFLIALHLDFRELFFTPSNTPFFNGFFQFSLIVLMFVTGLKIDLRQAARLFKKTFSITFFGILFPFITGVIVAWFFKNLFVLTDSSHSPFAFPLFMGIAFTISALPVIAKILMDVKILHTPTGAIIISTAFLIDMICWGLFTVMTELQSPGCLGAFLVGVIVNYFISSADIKNSLTRWVMNVFAPIFFVSIGLKIDFLTNFNWLLASIIFVTASASKIAGTFIGAHLSGIKGKQRSIISLALNARGAVEIIFSTIALNLGIISTPTYVALIIMAVLTSILSGILIKKIVSSSEHKSSRDDLDLQLNLTH